MQGQPPVLRQTDQSSILQQTGNILIKMNENIQPVGKCTSIRPHYDFLKHSNEVDKSRTIFQFLIFHQFFFRSKQQTYFVSKKKNDKSFCFASSMPPF